MQWKRNKRALYLDNKPMDVINRGKSQSSCRVWYETLAGVTSGLSMVKDWASQQSQRNYHHPNSIELTCGVNSQQILDWSSIYTLLPVFGQVPFSINKVKVKISDQLLSLLRLDAPELAPTTFNSLPHLSHRLMNVDQYLHLTGWQRVECWVYMFSQLTVIAFSSNFVINFCTWIKD